MADDLDDELLRLAGDSGDEEAASPDSPASHSPDDSSSMARKGTAKPVRRGRKSRKDEDGELYVVICSPPRKILLVLDSVDFFALSSPGNQPANATA